MYTVALQVPRIKFVQNLIQPGLDKYHIQPVSGFDNLCGISCRV